MTGREIQSLIGGKIFALKLLFSNNFVDYREKSEYIKYSAMITEIENFELGK